MCSYDTLVHCFLLSFCAAYFQGRFTIFLSQHFSENKNYTKCNDLRSRRRRRLKGILHSRSDTSRTGAEGLSFYYPRLLHCLDQMLAVMSLSQHRVSSSKTVRLRAPRGARCIGHAVSTWSAVHPLQIETY